MNNPNCKAEKAGHNTPIIGAVISFPVKTESATHNSDSPTLREKIASRKRAKYGYILIGCESKQAIPVSLRVGLSPTFNDFSMFLGEG